MSRVALIGGWDSCWCVRVQAAVSPSRGRLPIGCLARFIISAGRVMMQELVGHDFHLHFCFFHYITSRRGSTVVFFFRGCIFIAQVGAATGHRIAQDAGTC